MIDSKCQTICANCDLTFTWSIQACRKKVHKKVGKKDEMEKVIGKLNG
jgi:hypothetical protein